MKIMKFLKEDPYAKSHSGNLYKSKYGVAEKINSSIVLNNICKIYRSLLDISKLPEKLRTVLKAFDVKRRIIEKTVLHDVSLEIKPGGLTVVIGVSGAGKTTLLRIIAGALANINDMKYRSSSGEIKVPTNAKLALLIPGEHEPVFNNESLLEHIYRKTRDEYVSVEILNMCGISDAVFYRVSFNELSTGQKERAKLASLLAKNQT